MSAQATLTRVEARFPEAASACGFLPPLLVTIGGLSLGFLLWYEAMARTPGLARFANETFILALMGGPTAALSAWYFYGRYFASRCGISLITAMRWNAFAWIFLLVVPFGVLQPFIAFPMSRLTAVAVGLWALVKLVIS